MELWSVQSIKFNYLLISALLLCSSDICVSHILLSIYSSQSSKIKTNELISHWLEVNCTNYPISSLVSCSNTVCDRYMACGQYKHFTVLADTCTNCTLQMSILYCPHPHFQYFQTSKINAKKANLKTRKVTKLKLLSITLAVVRLLES